MLKRVLLGAAVLLGQSACLPSYDNTTTPSSVEGPKGTSDAPAEIRPSLPADSTSLWMQYGDPAELAARAQDEGPLDQSSRRHACYKFRFATLGKVMFDLGVNMTVSNQDPAPNGTASLLPLDVGSTFDCTTLVPSQTSPTDAVDRSVHVAQPARFLYCSGRLTLGMAPFAARLSESTGLTTAGTTKLFDTLAAAAIEISRDNLSKATRCADSKGVQAVLFNPDNTCNANGIACLQGTPPTPEQVNLCNRMVIEAQPVAAKTVTLTSGGTVNVAAITQVDAGKRVAAAAILANSLLCE